MGRGEVWLRLRTFAYVAAAGACLLALLVQGARAEPPQSALVPSPRLLGSAVTWSPVGVEGAYEVAVATAPAGTPGAVVRDYTVARVPGEAQLFRPPLAPGHTAYVSVSADGGLLWSSPQLAVTAPAPGSSGIPVGPPAEPPPTPGGGALSPGAGGPLVQEAGAQPGAEASLGEGSGAAAGAGSASTGTVAQPGATSSSRHVLIGTNDGWGWGTTVAHTILAAQIDWDRVELRWMPTSALDSLTDGFHVLAVVNAVLDGTPLSDVEPNAWGAEVAQELRANPGVSIAEAGNESYLLGGVANPVQYGRMYMAALRDMRADGIGIPLLFNMIGDYPYGTWANPTGWSLDSAGGGWLREAVKGVPGLGAAILANGVSIHPYGAIGEDVHDDSGVATVAADEAVAQKVLGGVPPVYITEFGYALGACGNPAGACSTKEQATKMNAAYNVLLGDPHVAGIWWYESHDDSTGHWGFMTRTNAKRPSFTTLSKIAIAEGQ